MTMLLPMLFLWAITADAETPSPTPVVIVDTRPQCPPDRPHYLKTYLACVECIVSSDCTEGGTYAGAVCYMGTCKRDCPSGLHITNEKLVRAYYEDLDAAIAPELAWSAFSGTEEDQIEVQRLYKNFEEEAKDDPKYNREDHGVDMNVCRCNAEKRFTPAINGFTMGYVTGHSFSEKCTCKSDDGWCRSSFKLNLFGFKVGSVALVPNGRSANCWGITDQYNWLLVSISSVAVFMAIFAYRSSSNLLWDFHRINLFNIIGTWVFVVMFVIKDPHYGGYNRFLGVGIFAHNAAEWNFMMRLWFGNSLPSRQMMTWVNIIYITVMMILVMSVDMTTQLVFLGAQGATLDTTFVMMALPMFYHTESKGFFRKGQTGFTVLTFVIAYLFHLVALLFAFRNGMSAGDLTIGTWLTTLVFTMLQFIMLQFFAYNQSNRVVWCGPYASASYNLIQEKGTKFALKEERATVSAAHEEVTYRMLTHAEVQLADTQAGEVKEDSVRDNGVFTEGLNRLGQDFPECCCLPEECRRKCNCCYTSPFFTYILIGAVIATIINVDLFVLSPKSVKFDSLDSGKCPPYYPIHGNGEPPAWIYEMTVDSNFMRAYAEEVTGSEDAKSGLAAIGIFVSAIMITILAVIGLINLGASNGQPDMYFECCYSCFGTCCDTAACRAGAIDEQETEMATTISKQA